jgi:hypothetical protein
MQAGTPALPVDRIVSLIMLFLILAVFIVRLFFVPFVSGWLQNPVSLFRVFSVVEITILTTFVGTLAFHLDQAGMKSSLSIQKSNGLLPFVSTLLFAFIVTLLHFIAWVPVEYAFLLALPCIFLPPLTYRVWVQPQTDSPIPLFSMEENCRILDRAAASSLIRKFLERYPDAGAYLYKSKQSHTAGGLLLHNKERLFYPKPTFLEITLDCPFTTRPGILAEGREIFRAYLSRPAGDGSIVSFLPQKEWDDWLIGLQKKEWFERIRELDTIKPSLPDLENLPYQFYNNPIEHQSIDLMIPGRMA